MRTWTIVSRSDPQDRTPISFTRDDGSTAKVGVGQAVSISDVEHGQLVRLAVMIPGGTPVETRSSNHVGLLVISKTQGALVPLVDL